MQTRDELILNHIGLYRLSFRRVVERMFFEGRNAGNVLQRLMDDGRIESRSGLPGRISYYQLTPAETTRRGLPIARARLLKSQSRLHHMGMLWFCCMSSTRRVRMEPQELDQFQAGLPAVPQAAHCLEGGAIPRIYRVEVVGPHTGITGLIQRLNGRIQEVLENHDLKDWLRTHRYAFALLVEAEQRRLLIERAIDRRGLRKFAHVITDYAPGHRTIAEALHDQRSKAISPSTKRTV